MIVSTSASVMLSRSSQWTNYDTALTFDPITMTALTTFVGTSQIVCGPDFPVILPAATVEGLANAGFTADELRGVERKNALRSLPKWKEMRPAAILLARFDHLPRPPGQWTSPRGTGDQPHHSVPHDAHQDVARRDNQNGRQPRREAAPLREPLFEALVPDRADDRRDDREHGQPSPAEPAGDPPCNPLSDREMSLPPRRGHATQDRLILGEIEVK